MRVTDTSEPMSLLRVLADFQLRAHWPRSLQARRAGTAAPLPAALTSDSPGRHVRTPAPPPLQEMILRCVFSKFPQVSLWNQPQAPTVRAGFTAQP